MSHSPLPWRFHYDWGSDMAPTRIVDATTTTVCHLHQHAGHPSLPDPRRAADGLRLLVGQELLAAVQALAPHTGLTLVRTAGQPPVQVATLPLAGWLRLQAILAQLDDVPSPAPAT